MRWTTHLSPRHRGRRRLAVGLSLALALSALAVGTRGASAMRCTTCGDPGDPPPPALVAPTSVAIIAATGAMNGPVTITLRWMNNAPLNGGFTIQRSPGDAQGCATPTWTSVAALPPAGTGYGLYTDAVPTFTWAGLCYRVLVSNQAQTRSSASAAVYIAEVPS